MHYINAGSCQIKMKRWELDDGFAHIEAFFINNDEIWHIVINNDEICSFIIYVTIWFVKIGCELFDLYVIM